MNDELVTSRWSDSSEESLQRRPSLWRRGTTERTTPQAEKGKVPLHRRIAKALGLKRDSKDKVDPNDSNITGIVSNPAADFDALGRPIRYPLSQQYKEPEEPEELALRIKSQEQLIATHRIFRGPVPRQPAPGVDPRTADEDAVALRGTLELAFLAPCEKKVLFLLRRSQRVSRFRPLLEPQNELLLVNTLDYDNILAAQTLVRELPDDERQLMWSNLHGQLLAHQSYILRLVLFHPEIRITTHTRGSGVESPEPFDRPETTQFFNQVQILTKTDSRKIRWGLTATASPNNGALVKREQSAPRLRLRGGGDTSWRSLRTYHDHLRSSRSVRRIEDEERAPTILWWLAGGNNRRGRRIPTGSELRARRAAEKENMQSVGFFGTVRGVRSRKAPATKAVAGETSKEEPDDTAEAPAPDAAEEVDEPKTSPAEAWSGADDANSVAAEAPEPIDAAVVSSKAESEVGATEVAKPPPNGSDHGEDVGEGAGDTPTGVSGGDESATG